MGRNNYLLWSEAKASTDSVWSPASLSFPMSTFLLKHTGSIYQAILKAHLSFKVGLYMTRLTRMFILKLIYNIRYQALVMSSWEQLS